MSTLNGQHSHEWTRNFSRGRNITIAVTECYIYHWKICTFLCSAPSSASAESAGSSSVFYGVFTAEEFDGAGERVR
jgi:hypothetical protein